MSQKRAKSLRKIIKSRPSRTHRALVDGQSTAHETANSSRNSAAENPPQELGIDGQIGAALGGLLARREERDSKGRFTHENTAHLGTLEHSMQLWAALEPLKQEMTRRVRRQLAVDTDDAAETLLGVIDGYVEARLLRSSAFVRLSQLGGFMTSKGKARALLGTWASAFDREMRAAERLGLEPRSKDVTKSPRAWLESLGNKQEDEEEEHREQTPDAIEQTGRLAQPSQTDEQP